MKTLLLLLGLAVGAFGQQALATGNPSVASATGNNTLPYTYEIKVDIAASSGAAITEAWGFGLVIYNYSNYGRLDIYSDWLTSAPTCQPTLAAGDSLYIRVVYDPDASSFTCEEWNATTGAYLGIQSPTWTSTKASSFSSVDVNGAAADIGFLRITQETTSTGGTIPLIYSTNANRVHEWKFEGDLTDSVGAADLSGAATYASDSNNPLLFARARVADAPIYTDAKTLRIGITTALDGTRSVLESETSSSAICAWAQTAGATATLTNTSSCSTITISAPSFGEYTIRLTASAMGAMDVTDDLVVGAVDADANGVVTLSSDATKIFGPMLALGWNPWGLVDERNIYSHTARKAVYEGARTYSPSYTYGSNPEWAAAKTGTVSYYWGGTVSNQGTACTTLTTGINSTDTSIVVGEASCLSLGTFPAVIVIAATNTASTAEFIRVCSTSATSGPATLTVCFDGRGLANGDAAQTWSSGAKVGQHEIVGTTTNFMGGAETMCEAGIGPTGPIRYSTGTAGVTAASTSVTGSGTSWTVNASAGDYIRIEATYNTGTPFIFVAAISSVGSNTAITLSRAFPAAGDTATGLTYQIIKADLRTFVLGFTRPTYGNSAQVSFPYDGGSGWCESDTLAYFGGAPSQMVEVTGMTGTQVTGQTYTYIDEDYLYLNQSSSGGINFYGEDLAWYSLWLRSGLSTPKQTAEWISSNWVHHPRLRGGMMGGAGSPLFMGGGVIGAIACIVVDPDCTLDWPDVRGWVGSGKNWVTTHYTTYGCPAYDSRDSGYLETWLALGALFDPDTTMGGYREQWRAVMDEYETVVSTCKGADNSWANGSYFNATAYPTVSLTNGSTAGTGTGFTSAICKGVASGNFSISGSTVTATSGTFSTGMTALALNDGTVRQWVSFTRTSSTTGTIGATWTGAGTGTWMQVDISAGEAITTWGNAVGDATTESNYECIFNSSTSITLERNWEYTTATYHPWRDTLAGFGQQPFMLGIKSFGMSIAANLDATLMTDFTTLRNQATAWVAGTGYDSTNVHGARYGAVFQSCEPFVAASGSNTWVSPPCNPGTSFDAGVVGRMLSAELQRALLLNAQATSVNTTALDAYEHLWCSDTYNDSTLYPSISACDSIAPGNSVASTNLSDASLASGKWPGFFFGMGGSHQFPALLLNNATPYFGPRISGTIRVTGAVSTR